MGHDELRDWGIEMRLLARIEDWIKWRMISVRLRILATLEAKTAKIGNFWTFCTVILLIVQSLHLHVKRRCISWITGQNVQKLLILAVLASSVASILNGKQCIYGNYIFRFLDLAVNRYFVCTLNQVEKHEKEALVQSLGLSVEKTLLPIFQ